MPVELHIDFSDLRRPPPALSLLDCSGIHFFYSPPFSQNSYLVTYPSLCSTCVTYRTPCHASGHQVLSTQPFSMEAEKFARGNRYFKHVLLFTHLIYFSPKGGYMVSPISMPKLPNGT